LVSLVNTRCFIMSRSLLLSLTHTLIPLLIHQPTHTHSLMLSLAHIFVSLYCFSPLYTMPYHISVIFCFVLFCFLFILLCVASVHICIPCSCSILLSLGLGIFSGSWHYQIFSHYLILHYVSHALIHTRHFITCLCCSRIISAFTPYHISHISIKSIPAVYSFPLLCLFLPLLLPLLLPMLFTVRYVVWYAMLCMHIFEMRRIQAYCIDGFILSLSVYVSLYLTCFWYDIHMHYI
jgi:hypothetical protein